MYDTGIRSPTELINVKVSDLFENCRQIHIREEIVKKGSFGRKINLMLCADVLRKYIEDNDLQPSDALFEISPAVTNRYLRRLAKRILGDGVSLAGDKYSHLTMYDFRHCSCCYWLPRYKSESALKYRFGWRKSDKIHYYSEMLGMEDTITEEDMLMDTSKTEIERRMIKAEQENSILTDKLDSITGDIKRLKGLMQTYVSMLAETDTLKTTSP
jgi:integrase